MKLLSRTVLSLYLLTLLWLVLFKFSYDVPSVLAHYEVRKLSLVPFAGYSPGNISEIISNSVVFIPFGLLASTNFKQTTFWQKCTFILLFSLTVEIVQYVFAIGVTDSTDVIMNTLGGFAGLVLYGVGKKYIDAEKLDRFIIFAGGILLVVLILIRIFVFKVRY